MQDFPDLSDKYPTLMAYFLPLFNMHDDPNCKTGLNKRNIRVSTKRRLAMKKLVKFQISEKIVLEKFSLFHKIFLPVVCMVLATVQCLHAKQFHFMIPRNAGPEQY